MTTVSPPSGPSLDPERCWKALSARDARFDGRFFVGVSSTGIYCRPVCSARTPRPAHCHFFGSAALAERNGYRPCLRCRPELAPGYSSVDARERLAQAGAALIEDGALGEGGVSQVARRLGVTDRHLRRVFDAQFGVSPIEYAQTQRLLLAKRLLTDTDLPVTEVALASGFSSLRRFNDCFATRYRLAPTELRRAAPAGRLANTDALGHSLNFRLAYRPPLDWDALLSFLSRRAISGVEAITTVSAGRRKTAAVYRRVVRVPGPGGAERLGWIEVGRPTGAGAARHLLEVQLSASLVDAIPAVLGRVRRAFDLGARPDEVALGLGDLAAGFEGIRLPGAFDGFEIAVRAVLGQQVTVRQASILVGRVVAAFGEPVLTPWADLHHAFPTPQRMAVCEASALGEMGIIGTRSRAIIELAGQLADGRLRLDPDVEPEATMAKLTAMAGIGDWTAQYIAMRALGWPDAFPAADAGVFKALGVRTAAQARAAAQAWRPWRGYAVMHLWRSLAVQPMSPSVSTESVLQAPDGLIPADSKEPTP